MLKNSYFQSGSAALLLALLIFLPLLLPRRVAAQFTVNVNSDVSPTGILRTSNSTKQLAESLKQGVTQIKQLSTQDTSLAKQTFEYSQVAKRWLEQVQQYTNEIFQMTRQFTSMKGVLGVAMQGIGLDSNVMQSMKDWAVAVYAIINVQRQFESLWESRITLFRNWYGRSKAGIYNPDQDWLDMQQFFLDSLGRRGYEYALEQERLKEADKEFGLWKQELDRLRLVEIRLIAENKRIDEEIQKETTLTSSLPIVAVDDASGQGAVIANQRTVSSSKIQILIIEKKFNEKNLEDTRARILELQQKMTNRYIAYYITYGGGIKGAEETQKEISGWDIFEEIKRDTGGGLFGDSPGEGNPPSPAPTAK